jgi:hypothetical protein
MWMPIRKRRFDFTKESCVCEFSGDAGMKVEAHIRWFLAAGLLLSLSGPLSLAQNRRGGQTSVPQPSQQQTRPSYSQPRSVPRPENRAVPAPQQQNPYRPPAQGHHFGQWLNQHRDQPLDQQRRALQNDPQFRHLPAQRQQEYVERLQRFNSLPATRQEQVLRRGEVWEHLRPQQRQDFRNFASQYRGLPPERRQAVRNAIQALRAMPPGAREREIQSGRFSQFSPQERQLLNDASNLPLAPAQPNANQPEPPQAGPGRYVPRPPH